MDGKVILITGAAGTGKSTLVSFILDRARPFRRIDYGQLLLEYKARDAGIQMTYDELRSNSASVITPEDVCAVDEWLIGQLPQWRTETNIVLDSHPVTKETFGFRVTPFSLDQVRRIGFDAILVLVGEPAELSRRTEADPRGRPSVNEFQAAFQVHLQAAVAMVYAIAGGRPCFAIDTSVSEANEVAEIALGILEAVGIPFER